MMLFGTVIDGIEYIRNPDGSLRSTLDAKGSAISAFVTKDDLARGTNAPDLEHGQLH